MAKNTPSTEKKIVRTGDARKGAALGQLIYARYGHGGISQFAQEMSVDRHTIQNWCRGFTWKTHLEETLARKFGVPLNFFARVGSGVPPELARQHDITHSENRTVTKLEALLEASPERIAGPFTLHEIQAHLRATIDMCFRLAMPSGEVTPQGLSEARRILRATTHSLGKGTSHLSRNPDAPKDKATLGAD